MAERKIKDTANDNELVSLACNNDEQALEQLLTRYHGKTLAMVRRYVDQTDDVQDISQEVLTKIYQSINSFRQGASFNTWHYRIVLNTISSHFRTAEKRFGPMAVNYEDFEGVAPQLLNHDSPQALAIAEELLTLLLSIIDDIPAQLREAMILYEFEGKDYEEISRLMDCPIGTVRSRIHRARKIIEQGLD